jgi:hypothetical protein
LGASGASSGSRASGAPSSTIVFHCNVADS